jgi:hypothetical protein
MQEEQDKILKEQELQRKTAEEFKKKQEEDVA